MKVKRFFWKWKIQIFCILMGFTLYFLAVHFLTGADSFLVGNQIQREGYGQYDQSYELYVDGLEEKPVLVEVPVSRREYTAEEAEKAFVECFEDLKKEILGENRSLSEVSGKLKLPQKIPKYGMTALWSSENIDYIDSMGTVYNENLKEAVSTSLTLVLSDGKHKKEFVLPLTIVPRNYTTSEQQIRDFTQYLENSDREQVVNDRFVLPEDWNGKKIHYRSKEKTNYSIIWMIGILFAVLIYMRDIVNHRAKVEKRSRQVLADYPDIVSKFMVFIGAGLSVRTAWEAIVNDYIRDREEDGEIHYAYEEMEKSLVALKTGVNETKVYRDFGRAIGIKQYMKFASLLEQNRKAGNAGLKVALSVESLSAWDERLSMARRLGEEASTKLLGPLFIMLGIVMLMIMIPALMTF